jgi:peptide/nickel transport system permease protein
MLLVSMTVFALVNLSPGSPEQLLLGANNPTEAALQAIREKHHFDRPIPVQYWYWLRNAVQGDLGTSLQANESVIATIAPRLPVTLALSALALLLTTVVSVPLGMLAAARRGKVLDRVVTTATTLGASAPTFVVGVLLLYFFGVWLRWFPVFGSGEGWLDRLWHLVLPAVTLAISLITFVTRQTRASALHVYGKDYMTSARARGLSSRVIWGRYAVRNSALPVVTSTGVVFAYTLTGAVLVEETFSLPGIGSLIVQSVSAQDIPVVQGVALLAAFAVVVINLVVDLAYVGLDPRVRRSVLR